MHINTIPRDLKTVIDSEQVDFIVKGKRNHPRKNGMSLLVFTFFWNVIVIAILISLINPVLKKKEVNSISEGIAKMDGLDTMFPIVFLTFFLLAGTALLIWALVMLFQKGGYFVGTENRLIKYRKGTIEINDWEQFSGNIEIKNNGQYGNLELELRTGKFTSSKNGARRFQPDVVYISQIKNVFDIEKKCRLRIQEHDPNPPAKSGSRY